MSTKHDGPIGSYNGSYLGCRGLRHAWAADPHWEITTGPRGRVLEYRRQLSCVNCPATAVATFDAEMRPAKPRKIDYPPGYLVSKDNPISPAAARLEQVRREVAKPGRRGLRLA